MCCTNFFSQTKVVTNQNPQLLCNVTSFDILRHYGVIAASQICSVSVSRKYCADLRNRFFSFFLMTTNLKKNICKFRLTIIVSLNYECNDKLINQIGGSADHKPQTGTCLWSIGWEPLLQRKGKERTLVKK